MTELQARKLGIIRCKHCKYPPNNHFGDGELGGKCARDSKCPGYKKSVILPSNSKEV